MNIKLKLGGFGSTPPPTVTTKIIGNLGLTFICHRYPGWGGRSNIYLHFANAGWPFFSVRWLQLQNPRYIRHRWSFSSATSGGGFSQWGLWVGNFATIFLMICRFWWGFLLSTSFSLTATELERSLVTSPVNCILTLPEKWWLEYYFPIGSYWEGNFSGAMLVSGGVHPLPVTSLGWPVPARILWVLVPHRRFYGRRRNKSSFGLGFFGVRTATMVAWHIARFVVKFCLSHTCTNLLSVLQIFSWTLTRVASRTKQGFRIPFSLFKILIGLTLYT